MPGQAYTFLGFKGFLYTFIIPILIFLFYILILIVKSQLKPPRIGPEALIGSKARVVEDLSPEGLVLIEGELWKARLAHPGRAPRGATVVIKDVEGSLLIVEEER